jgi:rhodanese-related sulfurtransferase
VDKKLLKELSAIIILSLVIAFTYNTLSEHGIPVIRKAIELKWESDTTIDKYINKDSLSNSTNAKIDKNSAENKKTKDLKAAAPDKQKKDTAKIVSGIVSKPAAIKKDPVPAQITPKTVEEHEPSKTITPTAITADQAYKIFISGAALFLDARMEAEFDAGHIKGAMSFPLKKFDKLYPNISNLSKEKIIVCYCDGSGCDLSIDLAKKLAETGFRNVKIFYSGWNDWKERKYPME